MSGALKFVKVIVAPARSPGGTLWKSAHKFQFMPWPPGVGARLRQAHDDKHGFRAGPNRPSARSLEPGADTARGYETADPPHLQINPAGGRYCTLMALQGEAVGRPFVLVGGVADAEVEGREILARPIDRSGAATRDGRRGSGRTRVVGRKNIIEPAAPDEAEMRRRHGVADRQRRKMADCAEPAGLVISR